MPQQKPHHHKCVDCGAKTECPGTFEQDWDPETVYCTEVDKLHHETICDECYEERQRQVDAEETEPGYGL